MKTLDQENIVGISALLVHAAKIDEKYSDHEKKLIIKFIKSYLKDGNFEDFLFYPPFPNPSYSQDLVLKLKVITPQKIDINVYNILGNEIWKNELSSLQSEQKNVTWNKKDLLGKKVANGIYFIKAKGVRKFETYKVIIVK